MTYRDFRFDRVYSWMGEMNVSLVPLFINSDIYRASENEMLWVFDVDAPENSFHVPARLLSEV